MPNDKQQLSLSEIATELDPFGPRLSQGQLEAIQKYVQLLVLWNDKVSLTGLADPAEIIRRHFGESIFAGKFVDFRHGRLADVGTGAGFPGLALKIAYSELEITLIEPNSKKSAFLREVVGQLGLEKVDVLRQGYETTGGKFDFICSRALGEYKNLLSWCRGALKLEGKVVFWIGQDDSTRLENIAGWQWEIQTLSRTQNEGYCSSVGGRQIVLGDERLFHMKQNRPSWPLST